MPDGSNHPKPLAFWDIEDARAEILRKADAMFPSLPRGIKPQGFQGLADSVARANAHRLRFED